MKMVIIEDDKEFQVLLKKYLEKDHELYFFETPTHALKQLPGINPEVIILDYFLPEFNADMIMAKLAGQLLNTQAQVLLLSAVTMPSEVIMGLKTLGVKKVLKKPISQVLLQEAIAEVTLAA